MRCSAPCGNGGGPARPDLATRAGATVEFISPSSCRRWLWINGRLGVGMRTYDIGTPISIIGCLRGKFRPPWARTKRPVLCMVKERICRERSQSIEDRPPQRATRVESKSRPRRFAKAMKIAARYRHLVPRARSILFYGTKNARTIIRDDRIQVHPLMNYPTISFTRSLHVAIHFAMLQRDVEETTGAILILDRELLRTRHKLVPYNYEVFDEPSTAEAEEMVEAGAIPHLKRYLLGVIWLREDEAYPRFIRRTARRK